MGGDRNAGRSRAIRTKIEMDDDKLIECVRKNPSLYELDHSDYGSGVSRAKTWKAIGAELKRHPLFCKRRWGNIRDNYKKAMKKYYWRLEQGYTKIKKYKFCDKLEFLTNQMEDNKYRNKDKDKNKKQSSNVASLEVKCEPDIDPEFDDRTLYINFNQEQQHQYYDDYFDQPMESALESQFEINHDEDTPIEQFDNYSQADTRVSDYEEEAEEQEKDTAEEEVAKLTSQTFETRTNSTYLGLRKKRKLKDTTPCESTNDKSTRYIVERVEADRFIERHPVDAFLSGISPTLKSLSAYYLSLAKTQIYSIVQEYEMAMIIERTNENHRV